ncbi:MAG: DUF5011 domain-containing protein [Clostridia bacterium]|nr:DUF5011 domain-containing protein [Clostridia bacterium]
MPDNNGYFDNKSLEKKNKDLENYLKGVEDDAEEFESPDAESAFEFSSAEGAAQTAAVEEVLDELESGDDVSICAAEDAGKDDADETPKKSKKKAVIIVIASVVAALIALGAAAYFFVKPDFSLLGKENEECEAATEYTDPGFSATVLGIDISDKVSVTGGVDTSKIGSYEIAYSLSYHGNDYTLTRTVKVVDKTPPEITLNGEAELTVSGMKLYKEEGCTAVDAIDGDLTESVTAEQKEDGDKVVVTYKVYDKSGNEATATRTVTVKDIVPPVITLNGDAEAATYDANWADPGASATDDLDGDISDKIVVTTDYVAAKEGTYSFYYTVSDEAGNEVKEKRTLTVTDGAAPEITLNGAAVYYLCVGDAFSDPGATANDAFEGAVDVAISGAPDTSAIGTYNVVYSCADSKGNASSVERKVVVMQRPTPVAGGITGGGFVSDSTIYLTFDDGPSYLTPQVLDILAEYNVKATFFILNYSDANRATVARAINEGHTIGIHGYSHDYGAIYQSPETAINNITTLHDKLVADFGYSTNITRFPGGSSNTVSRNYCKGVMSTVCPLVEQLGYNYFDWNVSSMDAAGNGIATDTIYHSVVDNIAHGRNNIVLMHDANGKATTVEALPSIIEYGLDNGYTFAGLSSNTTPVHHPINN